MKINMRKKISIFFMVLAMTLSVISVADISVYAAPASVISGYDYIGSSYKAAPGITLKGSAHVQTYGDVPGVWNAATGTLTLGTIGEGKRLEEINIAIADNKTGITSGGIEYKVHRQTYGWTPNWVSMGNNAGTRGQGKRLEAIEIRLTGGLEKEYSIVYVAHCQTYGWSQGPVCDGAVAGTSSEAKRVECIQVRIIPKRTVNMGVQYRVHRQTYGWEGSNGKSAMYMANGTVSGTTGQGKRLEGIEINLTGNQYSGNIEYRTHIQSYGWESSYSSNGEMSGTTGKAKRLEAIQIRLTGDVSAYYDVYYRVHAQTYGWLAWAKNDEISGTAGLAKRLEAIQIVLVPKNGAKPGNTYGGVTATNSSAYVSAGNTPGGSTSGGSTSGGSTSGGNTSSSGDSQINCSNITLYAMDSWADKYISIEPGMNKSFQIQVTGAKNVFYSVSSGNTVTVSASGLVEPKYTTWYWNGNIGSSVSTGNPDEVVKKEANCGLSTITVRADNKTYKVNVEVKDYVEYYVDKKINDYIAANVKAGMSDKEKIETAAKMAASYDYGTNSSSAQGMIVSGSGDCWASTDLIITYCKKLGYDAWARNGNRDLGAGSGHMNAMVKAANGDIYEAEAGYSGKAPRYYYVKKRTSLYDYRGVTGGIKIYQYSGKSIPATLDIPKTIDGNTVVAIGDNFIESESDVKTVIIPDTVKSIGKSAFNSCTSLTTLNIPASVTSIDDFAFTNCGNLTNFTCDASSSSYTIVNGILYNKNKDTVVSCPAATAAVLPSSVKKISDYSFYYNKNLTSVSISSGVTTIGEGAFGDCSALKSITLPETITEIGDFAFAQSGLTSITFNGNCPSFKMTSDHNDESYAFWYLNANVYYSIGKTGYNSDTMRKYGGTKINWIRK